MMTPLTNFGVMNCPVGSGSRPGVTERILDTWIDGPFLKMLPH